jgi:hypothetical protein
MLRYRTQGLLAVGLGLFAGGCFGEPDIRTDLRTEGPPDVLVGMGQSLPGINDVELPFYCRYVNGVRDEKTPGFVIDALLGSQVVCPDAEGDFQGTDLDARGFGVRIMFDELLDGDAVESLDCDEEGVCVGSLATTHPVNFTCGATTVDYDGYYVPNGNNTTFPLGPSLVIVPASIDVAAGTQCTITMTDVVHDRSGNPVDPAQADVDFTIAALDLVGTSPEDAEDEGDREVLDPDGAEVDFAFNAFIDEASIDPTDFELRNLDTDAVVAASAAVADGDVGGDAISITPDADLPAGNYVARLKANAEFAEVNGGTITLAEDVDVRFVVE